MVGDLLHCDVSCISQQRTSRSSERKHKLSLSASAAAFQCNNKPLSECRCRIVTCLKETESGGDGVGVVNKRLSLRVWEEQN